MTQVQIDALKAQHASLKAGMPTTAASVPAWLVTLMALIEAILNSLQPTPAPPPPP